jgi:transcription initiation factor TFIID subunit 2
MNRIPPEEARDLLLIKRKLAGSDYSTAHQVDDDFELMLENARMFNGDGPVVEAANALGAWWNAQRARMD